MGGAAGTGQRGHEPLPAVLLRQLPHRVGGALVGAGTAHSQGEDHGVSLHALSARKINHPKRFFSGFKERSQLRIFIQGVAHRTGHPLRVFRARGYHRQGTLGAAVSVLQHQ